MVGGVSSIVEYQQDQYQPYKNTNLRLPCCAFTNLMLKILTLDSLFDW